MDRDLKNAGECLKLKTWDFGVVGAGIVGCAVARELRFRYPEKSIVIIEKESKAGSHASGRNSGVIHSGINQKPGSLKAALCVRGSALLRNFCKNSMIPMREVGTVVLARTEEEGATLRELERRARANGVNGVRILQEAELANIEPYARGREALLSPSGGIVDKEKLVSGLAAESARLGVCLRFDSKVTKIEERGEHLIVKTQQSDLEVKFLINSAGLYADRVAQMLGVGYDFCVVPFRGDYYRLMPERSYLVNSMIYPTPDLEMPFLGIHLTKRTDGSVIVGPNALLAMGRENYRDSSVNWLETLQTIFDMRFIRLVTDEGFLRIALNEAKLSLSKRAFVKAAKELVPDICETDLLQDQSGIRAQLVDQKGRLVDDFVFERTDKSLHILNAVSPGLTCALAFAEHVANLIAS